MHPLNLIPSAPASNRPSPADNTPATHTNHPGEQFDSFIDRTLAKSDDSAPDAQPQEPPASGKPKTTRDSYNESASPAEPGPADNTQPAPAAGITPQNATPNTPGTTNTVAQGGPPNPQTSVGPLLLQTTPVQSAPTSGPTAPPTQQTSIPTQAQSQSATLIAESSSAPTQQIPSSTNQTASQANPGIPVPTAGNSNPVEAEILPAKTASHTPPAGSTLPNPAAAPATAGISTAQQPLGMLKAEKTSETAVAAQQKVPVPSAPFAGEQLPTAAPRPARSLPHQARIESASTTDSSASNLNATERMSLGNPPLALAPESGVKSLERAQDLMALHATRLRESGSESLHVVIKPSPGLQLSLNLQMRDGTVDIQATLQRGDFDLFNRHWSELQLQLEPRGVKLSSLVCSDQNADQGHNLFQQRERESEAGSGPQPAAFGEFVLPGNMKSSGPHPATNSGRGWESWA